MSFGMIIWNINMEKKQNYATDSSIVHLERKETEFSPLKPATYSYLTDDNTEKKPQEAQKSVS